MLFLFELPNHMSRLEAYGQPEPLIKATPTVLHEISLRIKCKPGQKYIVVPSPRKPGTLGQFNLSFYTSCPMVSFDVKRIDDPKCRCKSHPVDLIDLSRPATRFIYYGGVREGGHASASLESKMVQRKLIAYDRQG